MTEYKTPRTEDSNQLSDKKRQPHILVQGAARTEAYRFPPRSIETRVLPERERTSHALQLLASLDCAKDEAEARRQQVGAWAVPAPAKGGIHLDFESEPGFDLELKSLDSQNPKGIQLVAVRESPLTGVTIATVFVPEGKLKNLEKKIRKFAETDTRKGQPCHAELVQKISHLRLATLRSFWTDEASFPATDEGLWWEVWLRTPAPEMLEKFKRTVEHFGIKVGERSLAFPSTQVVLAHGTVDQLTASIEIVDAIAELRRAKEVPSVFMEMRRTEMGAWVADLLDRTQEPSKEAPSICLLDTGVNAGHPLLRLAIEESDLHAVDPRWRSDDHDGHGTCMAGLALYGDLSEALSGSHRIELAAKLESVKILPRPPDANDPDLYGEITKQAVYRIEVERPNQTRTHALAITMTDGRDRGKPSSWSAAVDQLAYGGDGNPQRLFVISAGNSDKNARSTYPHNLETEEVHDPAQAWNALTVGAYTDRWQIEDSDFTDWEPVARPGELSPSTTTSAIWKPSWPLKPDVVFEGGNSARSPAGEMDQPDSLSLLTTHLRPSERLFTTFGDTSAASALCARMAASLQKRYPQFWPETIRGLIVHSATWTSAMRERYGPLNNKRDYEQLVRRCGFGVPSWERALWSADNRLTLVAQEELQPFVHKENAESGARRTTFKELQILSLPWPLQQLRELGEVGVELRITLSYFIEPNPSERGHSVSISLFVTWFSLRCAGGHREPGGLPQTIEQGCTGRRRALSGF